MVTLLLGYLAVNYLVVREIASELMDLEVSLDADIPFAVVFYGLTFLIPLVYFLCRNIYREQNSSLDCSPSSNFLQIH